MEYLRTKTGRAVAWVVLNFGLLLGLILGSVYEWTGVINVVVLVLWVFSLISWAYFSDTITDNIIKESIYLIETPYPVPKTVFWGYDILMLLTLAFLGYFVLAIAYIISLLGQMVFYEKIEDMRKGSNK